VHSGSVRCELAVSQWKAANLGGETTLWGKQWRWNWLVTY